MMMGPWGNVDLAHTLENTHIGEKVHRLPVFDQSKSVFILDAMACIQALHVEPRQTFNDISSLSTTQLVKGFAVADSLMTHMTILMQQRQLKQSRGESLTVGSRKYEVKSGWFNPHGKGSLIIVPTSIFEQILTQEDHVKQYRFSTASLFLLESLWMERKERWFCN